MEARTHTPSHLGITAWLVAETVIVYLLLAGAAVWLWTASIGNWFYLLYPPVLLAQGLWLDRIYIVGHEGAHRKLLPQNRQLNDWVAGFVLLPILVPINIYRKIHVFHHGFNRKDHHTSALDVFVSRKPLTWWRKLYFQALWYIGVFGGGYFLHSLVSVFIFLLIPTPLARKISPAFKGWGFRDWLLAAGVMAVGVGLQVLVYQLAGGTVWRVTFLYPLLLFSWIWSLLVYIFHYDTTVGDPVRYNVRSLRRHWFFSWLLMNFNEHATHHMHPNIPWYQLPASRKELPDSHQHNQKVATVFQAILHQLKGPTIVYEPSKRKT